MKEFGSDFEIDYYPNSYFSRLSQLMPYSAFTRSGREAIGLSLVGMTSGTALLPAYCCKSMALPFDVAGWEVVYYPLNADLSIDLGQMCSLLCKFNPRLVLVMNYFGYTPVKGAVEAIKSFDRDILVMEDFTHCLFYLDEIWNPLVDIYVASIRKSLGVSDGGLILSKSSIDTCSLSEQKSIFVNHHLDSGRLKKKYSYSLNPEEKSVFRKLQSIAGSEILMDRGLYKISNESRYVLDAIDIDTVRYARRMNYLHLYSLIKDNPGFSIVFPPGDNPSPFMLVIMSKDRDLLQSELARKGVYCQVLWPLSDDAKGVCPVSKEMENSMLAIPIDQRYDYADIEEIASRINTVCQ